MKTKADLSCARAAPLHSHVASVNAIDSFAARTPGGYTPTGPALAGALKQAQDRAKANPDHKVVVVLVTDGLPGGFIPNMPPAMCTPGDIAGVAALVATGTAGTPPIPTFVIGVFGPCDLVDANVMPQANLDRLAMSGGTNKAVVISTDQNVTQQLQDALKMVRTSASATAAGGKGGMIPRGRRTCCRNASSVSRVPASDGPTPPWPLAPWQPRHPRAV